MIKEIAYNPYRILGVYSNSSKKEQIANKGKNTCFSQSQEKHVISFGFAKPVATY